MGPAATPWYRVREVHLSGNDGLRAVVEVPSGSGWFCGHFPGNPVLPGIAQMAMVFDLMKQAMDPLFTLGGFKRVRFKQLIKPDTEVTICVEPQVRGTGTFAFRLMTGDEVACSGFIRVIPGG